ncbi:MAG: CBS domain-containing protein [Roseiflexaceae bacterium]|jgi:CBS domain-containing protein
MQIKDVMTREVEVIHPDATLEEAAAKMDALNVGSLPVCDGDRVLGVITDRDITVRATAVGGDPTMARTRDAMTAQVIYGFEDQDVTDAARLMNEHQIRRLIVLNRDKRLVGIVALGDLAVDTGDEQLAGATLKQVSEPAEPDRS